MLIMYKRMSFNATEILLQMLSICSRSVTVILGKFAPVLSKQFHLSALNMAPIKVGDKVPQITLFEDTPGGKVELDALCAGKKVVVFGRYPFIPF